MFKLACSLKKRSVLSFLNHQEEGYINMKEYRQFCQITAIATIIIIVLLTSYKVEQNAIRRANFLERDIKTQAAYELGREVDKRIKIARENHITLNEFTTAFGIPMELTNTTDPENANFTHSYFHDKSQRLFFLRFSNEQLEGYSSHYSSSDVKTGVILETPAFLKTEFVRKSILAISQFAWIVLLLAGSFGSNFRKKAFAWLIIFSIVCGLCWFLNPSYPPTIQGISSNDYLGFFVVMIIISLFYETITSCP
jgi:hypothetical protein